MLSSKHFIDQQINEARKALFGMRTRARELHLKVDIQVELFDKLVVSPGPVLLYGCQVWGFGDLKPVEIFYSKFLKRQLTGRL